MTEERLPEPSAESIPRIWVDWNGNIGPQHIELFSPTTVNCFAEQGVSILEGLRIRLYGDEVEADAMVVRMDCNGHVFLVAEIIEGTLVEVD